jgi:tripartite-type tricarboxylate transporter receptor subunit TctC
MNDRLLTRRSALAALAGTALPATQGRRAFAQAKPTLGRIAKLVVGYSPGGPTDTIARLVAERLRGVYAPEVIVDNRSGAAGRLGVEAVKAAAADGTTLLMTPAAVLTILPHVYPRTTRYDALIDLVPVSSVCASPYAFAVRADHPAKDLAGFVVWAHQQGDDVAFASPAAGGGPHFVGVKMARNLGIRLTHVPYRGAAPAVQDVIGGQVPGVVVQVGDVSEFHRAGQLRILAITSETRLPSLPDVPTFRELGQSDMTSEEWFGVLLPARTPAPIVEGLHAALIAAAVNPGLQEALGRQELHIVTSTPQEFAQLIRSERDKWGPVVRESGFKADE